MAIKNPVRTHLSDDSIRDIWTGTAGDTFTPAGGLSEYDDRTIQVAGTFDTATIEIHGSADDENFSVLGDNTGTALSWSLAKVRTVVEYVSQIKPVVTGGAGNTDLKITLLAKRKRR